jgi:Fe-S-cluster-containing dehydrogenase component/anaerobic selenocysteine-containing dehydrogenase
MAQELTFFKRRADVDGSRRDFLTRLGFTVAASALASCTRGPVQKAIPFLNKPEEITPGVASWYATTCAGCSAACPLLVKTRDGRPIKIEGNSESPQFGGGTCATGQATVLSLYDPDRLTAPMWQGETTTWPQVDEEIAERLEAARGRGIVLLSSTVAGPSTRALIRDWAKRFPKFRHVAYDAVSFSGLRQATRQCFGTPSVPHYRFDRASTIVGIDADFLGTWLSPVEFTHQYAARRRRALAGGAWTHYQFEAGLSLTGGNADRRVAIAASELGAVALALLRRVSLHAGAGESLPAVDATIDDKVVAAAADDLWRDRGRSIVVCGSNDPSIQVVALAINSLLGNIGATIDLDSPSLQKQGDDEAMAALVDDMERGDVHVLMTLGVNPAYDFPDAARFARAMESVALTISFSDRLDETAIRSHAVCPDHHFLEAWGDAEPVNGSFSLAQPTAAPLFNTRAVQDGLLAWLGEPADFYAYVREFWRRELYPKQQRFHSFDEFWDHALHDGVFVDPAPSAARPHGGSGANAVITSVRSAVRAIALDRQRAADARASDRYDLHLYETVGLRDGRHANNPWLQELPDPVTKVTWGNYVVLAPSTATALGVASGDVVRVAAGDRVCELPAHVQPGQAPRTVSIALGYGRERAGRVGRGVGVNVFPLVTAADGRRAYVRSDVVLQRLPGRQQPLAATQTHHTVDGRPIIRTITLEELVHGDAAISAPPPSLWPEREEGEHHWSMVVDLNACTGCSACVTACQAENNVPVVGEDEVRRGREMHWIRIDRYYDASDRDGSSLDVSFQPMMCQHCQNAPCETVCPVLATVHSSDGLNQQIYNRCIGTRYCENNCPYKVRRFNWFQYAGNAQFDFTTTDPLERMVLNPDVVVRSRGVMEKCSLCVQRIQAEKLSAKQQGRALIDGRIKTACQQACPADAIVFGDLNDPESEVSRLRRSRRHYTVLEELGTRPNVGYLMKVRNQAKTEEPA